ncbi:MAG: SCP2 sterol-binding domain-containing protein [Mycobacterium leprae]
MPSVKEFLDQMRSQVAANPAKIAGLNARYQFELTGEGGGVYHANFDNGTAEIGESAPANPTCTITMAVTDFEPLMTGKLNPAMAFMNGKLKVHGDISQALKLQMLIG